MNQEQRLHLQNLINENEVIDKTDMIRDIKHSNILRTEVQKMVELRKSFIGDSDEFRTEAIKKCEFLFKYYTDIFNKLKNDEIDLNMLFEFLDILEKIEKGDINQHEASFKVGTILKSMYIDSAIKKADKMDKEYEKEKELIMKKSDPPKSISWKNYKQMQL